jgi:hypothetical protein
MLRVLYGSGNRFQTRNTVDVTYVPLPGYKQIFEQLRSGVSMSSKARKMKKMLVCSRGFVGKRVAFVNRVKHVWFFPFFRMTVTVPYMRDVVIPCAM